MGIQARPSCRTLSAPEGVGGVLPGREGRVVLEKG